MIQVEGLTKIYDGHVAVQSLDFEVSAGEIVGFLGPNGAGKTTTMRILAGALSATSGVARIGGIDVFQDPRRVKAMVGYLPERPPLYPEMTVHGYLKFCARIKGASNPAAAVDNAIQRVGLRDVAHRLIDHLSKGFRQRVGIASALVHSPKVLILDEPASGLDPAQRVEIRRLVQELAAGDTTVLLSTHVLPEVEAICDRVVILDRGRIALSGRIDDLSNQSTTVTIQVARPSDALVDAIGALTGVTGISATGKGRYAITVGEIEEGAVDIRESIAAVATRAGLLSMTAERALEDIFLQLTESTGTDA